MNCHNHPHKRYIQHGGFTLMEMSIVLVIIGLIIGGVLVGQDLVKAAEMRGQIAQIEKYNAAVNVFYEKYGGLPGDLALASAKKFNFPTDASCTGGTAARDGNNLIEGFPGEPLVQGDGETGMFWQDITTAKLIDGSFPNSGGIFVTCTAPALILTLGSQSSYVGNNFPLAKIGRGNFLYVYTYNGLNWFGMSAVTAVNSIGSMASNPATSPLQAYAIDQKTDDGLPTTGKVQAVYISGNGTWPTVIWPSTNAANDTSVTCYNTSQNTYSTSSAANGGTGLNCGLSFQMISPGM